MDKKKYNKPETTLFELKYRNSIILSSPDPDSDDPEEPNSTTSLWDD